MPRVIETFVVGGIVKMRRAFTAGPFLDVGLVSTYQQAHEKETMRMTNTRIPTGGTYAKDERVTSMTIAINFREFISSVMATLLWASVKDVPSAVQPPESVVVKVGMTSVLTKMPLEITALVEDTTDPDPEEFDLDNIKMTGAGFEVLEGGDLATAIGSKDNFKVKVTYKCADYDEIQALVNSGEEWEILFEGANGSGTKGRVNNRYWRCKFGLVESLDWISVEDYMGMQATAEVLADESRVGDSMSQYMATQKETRRAA
ncbi:hypothetical protein QYE80_08115 [Pseudomonas tohonis]|nr:hypothetical protein L682_27300 [Pseudomonas alcaligenes OT 69]MDN4144939.1 hypothetical protein [Pseudomonas tohonis]